MTIDSILEELRSRLPERGDDPFEQPALSLCWVGDGWEVEFTPADSARSSVAKRATPLKALQAILDHDNSGRRR